MLGAGPVDVLCDGVAVGEEVVGVGAGVAVDVVVLGAGDAELEEGVLGGVVGVVGGPATIAAFFAVGVVLADGVGLVEGVRGLTRAAGSTMGPLPFPLPGAVVVLFFGALTDAPPPGVAAARTPAWAGAWRLTLRLKELTRPTPTMATDSVPTTPAMTGSGMRSLGGRCRPGRTRTAGISTVAGPP